VGRDGAAVSLSTIWGMGCHWRLVRSAYHRRRARRPYHPEEASYLPFRAIDHVLAASEQVDPDGPFLYIMRS
jgi:hypothetical protein